MSPSMEKERIDHQILNPIFSRTEPERNTLAEYHIHLAAFFCISVPECLGECVGKHPEKLWVKIPNYFCLSAYQQFIFPLLFYKRLCDVFDEETQTALAESDGDEQFSLFPENHRFQWASDGIWKRW